MNNEILFFLQIIIIGIFLFLFGEKKYTSLFSYSFIYLFIFLNLLGGYETIIFNIHCNIVEPLGIFMYFSTIFLYSWNKENIDNLFKNIYIINFFLGALLAIILKYNFIENKLYSILIKEYLYNGLTSIISLNLSYYIERIIFLKTLTISSPWRESTSVIVSQLFDTIFYTLIIFYHKPYHVILQIIVSSYIIKLICITSYTSFLLYKKKYTI